MRIGESFGAGRRTRVPLERAASDFDATHVAEAAESVDSATRTVRFAGGRVLPYDSLIVALGRPRRAVLPACRDCGRRRGEGLLHGILADLEEGYLKRARVHRSAGAVGWTLPLYELALLTAADAWSMGIDDAQLVARHPGGAAARDVRARARARPSRGCSPQRGIEFVGGSRASVRRGEIVLVPGGRRLSFQRAFALPSHRGPGLPGLPCDDRGFLPMDLHGRVTGVDGVFAAGDATTFPIKQGGIAAQQAEAAAQSVAARHGCAIEPEQFRPVLRGNCSPATATCSSTTSPAAAARAQPRRARRGGHRARRSPSGSRLTCSERRKRSARTAPMSPSAEHGRVPASMVEHAVLAPSSHNSQP